MYLPKFRDRKAPHRGGDLQDALYLVHIASGILRRYAGNADYGPDADDLLIVSEIILQADELGKNTVALEALFRGHFAGKG